METVEMPVDEIVEEPVEKPRKPGTFVKGDPRRHDPLKASKGEKKAPDPATYVAVPEGASEQYASMWHVAKNPAGFDASFEQKEMRKYQKKKPDAFYALYLKLAEEHRVRVVGGAMTVASGPDDGAERCEALIERLLDEFEAEEAGR